MLQKFEQGSLLLALGGKAISYLIRSFLGQVIGFLHLLCSEVLWCHLRFVPRGAGQAKVGGEKGERGSSASLQPEDMCKEGPTQEDSLLKK